MTRRVLETCTVVATALVLVFATYVLLRPVPTASTGYGSLPPSPLQQPSASGSAVRAAFLGDALIRKDGNGVAPNDSWPALLSAKRDWKPVRFAAVGASYTAGPDGQTLDQRVPELAATRPDVVIVWSSGIDRSAARIAKAAPQLYADLKERLPQAKIVIVGPVWWVPGPDIARFRAVRDVERTAAESAGLPFIDPLHDGWFRGANVRFLNAESLHPTAAGQQHIADLLDGRLRELGVRL